VTLAAGHALDDETLDWRTLARPHHTVVFYMGVAQLPRIVARLLGAGADADHPAAIIERASLAEQRVLRGTLGTLVQIVNDEKVEAPALLIIGEVASLATDDADVTSPESTSVDTGA
jgi:siroheme synthase